jgi:hypothetical protein
VAKREVTVQTGDASCERAREGRPALRRRGLPEAGEMYIDYAPRIRPTRWIV